MSSHEGRIRLKNYLDMNPEWDAHYSQSKGFYATRNLKYNVPFSNTMYYVANTLTGEKQRLYAQYLFCISIDGKSIFNFDTTNSGSKIDSSRRPISIWTWFKAGDAKITIYDSSDFEGRQMTAKILELAENEFTELKLPEDAVIYGRKPEYILYDGAQGGIYFMEILSNPGEPGLLYLKANEITTGTKLSETRLPHNTARIFGSSNPDELFKAQLHFKIYEGNWGQYYGAHIELWFIPDSGGAERKIFENDYKIEGWTR